MTFNNRVVVTGAASGIGRAIALGFGRQGARLARCDQNADGEVQTHVLDITNQAQVQHMIDQVVQTWGQLDILVNAAGISRASDTSRGPVLPL